MFPLRWDENRRQKLCFNIITGTVRRAFLVRFWLLELLSFLHFLSSLHTSLIPLPFHFCGTMLVWISTEALPLQGNMGPKVPVFLQRKRIFDAFLRRCATPLLRISLFVKNFIIFLFWFYVDAISYECC